jgi:hypothetical protein
MFFPICTLPRSLTLPHHSSGSWSHDSYLFWWSLGQLIRQNFPMFMPILQGRVIRQLGCIVRRLQLIRVNTSGWSDIWYAICCIFFVSNQIQSCSVCWLTRVIRWLRRWYNLGLFNCTYCMGQANFAQVTVFAHVEWLIFVRMCQNRSWYYWIITMLPFTAHPTKLYATYSYWCSPFLFRLCNAAGAKKKQTFNCMSLWSIQYNMNNLELRSSNNHMSSISA